MEEENEEEEDGRDESETNPSLNAKSSAVLIAQPSPLLATTPTMAKIQAGYLGSYHGRPVVMPVVRNPDVHAQAASLGQLNPVVGGLHRWSRMDEGDVNSICANVSNMAFSSTPRSFAERLMMEDSLMKNKGDARLAH